MTVENRKNWAFVAQVVFGAWLLSPSHALADQVTIQCFLDEKLPVLSEGGRKFDGVVDIPYIGVGVVADYDNSGLVHFEVGGRAYVTYARLVQLKPEAGQVQKAPPAAGGLQQSFASKGPTSLCPSAAR